MSARASVKAIPPDEGPIMTLFRSVHPYPIILADFSTEEGSTVTVDPDQTVDLDVPDDWEHPYLIRTTQPKKSPALAADATPGE